MKSKGKMISITLRSGKQLEEQNGSQENKDEGLMKNQWKEILEEKKDSSLEDIEQNKDEGATKPKPVDPYQPLIPFFKG